jgi:zinc protease
LASLLSRLLVKGTRRRTDLQVAEALESIGGAIDAFCTYDMMGMETQTVAEDWAVALDVMGDCLMHSIFDAGQCAKEKAMMRAGLLRALDSKFTRAYRLFLKGLYGRHPYGIHTDGTLESVERLTRGDVVKHHDRYFHPENFLIVVVGNVPEYEFLDYIDGKWELPGPNRAKAAPTEPDCKPGDGGKREVTESAELEQAYAIRGFMGPAPGTHESTALRLFSAMLGEGMSGRLFARLRDRDHLAYAVGSTLAVRSLCSHFMTYIGTRPETLDAAAEGLEREVNALLTDGPSGAEFKRAVEFATGHFLMGRQTNAAVAHSIFSAEITGLGWEWAESYPERVRSITQDEMMDVARKYLGGDATMALLVPETEDVK